MISATYQWLCPQKRQRSEAERRARSLFYKRSWYEVVILSIPVFVAAGVNNFVAAIIVLSSEDAEDHLGAEIGQQFLYTFLFSYLIGKWLFHSVAKHIIACQASQTVEDRWGLLDFCKRTKSLTLLARAINENASFSIKEFMMLVLVEKVYEEEGFGAAFGGWWLGFAVFVLVLLVSTLMASGLFRLEGEMVHWLKEYDVDSFALGAGAVFVALVGKGLSVEGVTFISPNSVFYGPSAADDDGAVAGNTAAYSLFFSLGITFFLDFYYRTMLHRRRLAIIAIKLTVGWTWEVVVASFLKLVTESIELTAAQEVGVRLAIVVIILISSAAVFYWFKDGEALYLIDPFADPEVTTAETELRPGNNNNNNNNTPDNNDVAVNPMASRSTMNR
eukprot:gene5807-4164_t